MIGCIKRTYERHACLYELKFNRQHLPIDECNVWFMSREMRFELILGSIRLPCSIDFMLRAKRNQIPSLAKRNAPFNFAKSELEKRMSFSLYEDKRVSLIHVLERTE